MFNFLYSVQLEKVRTKSSNKTGDFEPPVYKNQNVFEHLPTLWLKSLGTHPPLRIIQTRTKTKQSFSLFDKGVWYGRGAHL